MFYGPIKKERKLIKKYKELLSKLSNMTEDNEEKKTMLMDKEKMEKELIPIREELDREKYLGSYSSFEGSPASKGILQFDMWNVEPSEI